MREKVIRDAVHGDIYIDNKIFLDIINTSEMQRLRRILQLGGASLAYPSATHTRFSHSIGVFYVVGLFLDSEAFKNLNKKEKILVRLAGLLHDVGHGAFSHTFEKITTKSHEEYTAEIITNPNGEIYHVLKKHKINPKDVCDIIHGTYPNELINLLVSSQLDADRLDYLLRDSYHCGVDYAALDIKFIVRHLKNVDNKLVYPKKAIHAIESYLLGRYHMYQQVYNHKQSIAFDTMFVRWYQRAKDLYKQNFEFKDKYLLDMFIETFEEKPIPISKYLEFDDYVMFSIFRLSTFEDDKILSDLSSRLLNRHMFGVYDQNEIDIFEIKDKMLSKGYDPKYYFVEFKPKKSVIYKSGIIDNKDETIYIENFNLVKRLDEISNLASSMNKINKTNNEKKFLFPKELV